MTCKFCKKTLNVHVLIEPRKREVVTYYHADGNYHCRAEDIHLETPAPECHICGTCSDQHGEYCSAAGMPQYHAKPEF